MPKLALEISDPVAQTLLLPLHARLQEAGRPHPLVRDERAVRIASQLDYNAASATMSAHDQVATLLRLRQFDRRAQDFLRRTARPVVVHLGCGLDTRFDRLDDGRVRWVDLDLPEVIDLRRKLIGETARCRMLGRSALDPAWMDEVGRVKGPSCLFLAEGVLPYFEPAQVRWLVQTLHRRFPGSELVFDALSPGMIRLHQVEIRRSRVSTLLQWGLAHPKELEGWADGIRLLNAWYYFDEPEPRLGAMRLMRFIPFFARGVGVFHVKLGNPVAPS